jgi:hypothetical protein
MRFSVAVTKMSRCEKKRVLHHELYVRLHSASHFFPDWRRILRRDVSLNMHSDKVIDVSHRYNLWPQV